MHKTLKAVQEHRNHELKKLEYQDFKFDVPLSGSITFKIMFEPGVLPEEFPQTRERRTRKPMPQGAEPQGPVSDVVAEETHPADAFPTETVEALAQALEDAQAAGESVDALAEAVANDEAIKTKIIGDEATGRVLVITAEPGSAEAATQPEIDQPARKPRGKDKRKEDAAALTDI